VDEKSERDEGEGERNSDMLGVLLGTLKLGELGEVREVEGWSSTMRMGRGT